MKQPEYGEKRPTIKSELKPDPAQSFREKGPTLLEICTEPISHQGNRERNRGRRKSRERPCLWRAQAHHRDVSLTPIMPSRERSLQAYTGNMRGISTLEDIKTVSIAVLSLLQKPPKQQHFVKFC